VNKLIYEELAQKQKDPQTYDLAETWNPRAGRIQQCSKSLKVFIESIKVDLVSQSDSLKKDYVELTKQLHNTDGIGQQLLNKLADFKDSLSTIIYPDKDSIPQVYRNEDLNHLFRTIPLLPGYGDSLSTDQRCNYKKKWLEENFGRSSSLMAMIMLNKIESDVLLSEKAFITYCNWRVAVFCGMGSRMFSAISVLSSSYVKAGQPIEVTTGVGSFSDAAKPRITINGKEVKVGNDATAIYKFIATGTPGKHFIPVTIEYTKPDGSNSSVSIQREYIIAEN
jgi:carbonic anhydrase/acetyltransferase-like protein (isoleucine patch superfamily)